MGDVMLHGVLRMPPDLWRDDPIDVAQRHSRYIEASDRIYALEAENARLRALAPASAEPPVGWSVNEDGRYNRLTFTIGVQTFAIRLEQDREEDDEHRAWMAQMLRRALSRLAANSELIEPVFSEVWKQMEAKGYRYGDDALENVRFGWELYRRAILAAPPSTQPVAKMVAACCGRSECGGECGNEWRGMEPAPPPSVPAFTEAQVLEAFDKKWAEHRDDPAPHDLREIWLACAKHFGVTS